MAKDYCEHENFGRFAVTSADVQVVNDAINNGSNPEDLVLMPAGLFPEKPTANGMEKAQEMILKKLASKHQNHSPDRPTPDGKKPGWKFW